MNPDHLEPVTHKENTLRGTGPVVANARKNRCIRGHEFTPENTGPTKNGRRCRTCHRQWEEAKRRAQGTHGGPKTHCKHGHELTAENVYIIPTTGHRQCRTCSRQHKRNHKAKIRHPGSQEAEVR